MPRTATAAMNSMISVVRETMTRRLRRLVFRRCPADTWIGRWRMVAAGVDSVSFGRSPRLPCPSTLGRRIAGRPDAASHPNSCRPRGGRRARPRRFPFVSGTRRGTGRQRGWDAEAVLNRQSCSSAGSPRVKITGPRRARFVVWWVAAFHLRRSGRAHAISLGSTIVAGSSDRGSRTKNESSCGRNGRRLPGRRGRNAPSCTLRTTKGRRVPLPREANTWMTTSALSVDRTGLDTDMIVT